MKVASMIPMRGLLAVSTLPWLAACDVADVPLDHYDSTGDCCAEETYSIPPDHGMTILHGMN